MVERGDAYCAECGRPVTQAEGPPERAGGGVGNARAHRRRLGQPVAGDQAPLTASPPRAGIEAGADADLGQRRRLGQRGRTLPTIVDK